MVLCRSLGVGPSSQLKWVRGLWEEQNEPFSVEKWHCHFSPCSSLTHWLEKLNLFLSLSHASFTLVILFTDSWIPDVDCLFLWPKIKA